MIIPEFYTTCLAKYLSPSQLKLLKGYEVVIIGDREFRSVELAYWLKKKKVCFALRLKQDAFVKKPGKTYQKRV